MEHIKEIQNMEHSDEFSFSRPYLAPGEVILWRGKPGKGNLFVQQDIFLIPFSIFWCGFAVFWEVTVLVSGAPFFFGIWGIPFVCVGLYIVFGRFLWKAHIRKHTAYVITNRKIVRCRKNRIDMLEGKNMPSAHITAHKDGSGTIRFGQPTYGRRNNGFGTEETLFTLDNVPDVARVQQILFSMER